jgi:6-phosphogluconolactonase
MMEIIQKESAEEACNAAARRISTLVASDPVLSDRNPLRLALPGGRSIRPLIRALAHEPFPWAQSVLFLADELVLPANDTERNDAQVGQALSEAGISIGPGGLCFERPPIVAGSPITSAEAYTETLTRYGNSLDVIVLGLGEDGHVASLFPGSPQAESNVAGYIAVNNSPKPPPNRITIGPRTIADARLVVLLAFGPSKQETRSRLDSTVRPSATLPASLAHAASNVILVTDLAP